MNAIDMAETMLSTVESALGPEWLSSVAFVGGCTTGFHLTDMLAAQSVRYTDDVDLIVDVVVVGRVGWYEFQSKLRDRGFTESPLDDVTCRMRLGELKVDFMPDDESILGFQNPWYSESLRTAMNRKLQSGKTIKLVRPEYFLATQFSAYAGRGRNDPLASHDMEDILTVIDGRRELVDELSSCSQALRVFLSEEFNSLIVHRDFEYVLLSAVRGDAAKQVLLNDRILKIAGA